MATYIKTLKDSNNENIIYPKTKASAVFLEDNLTNVQTKLDSLQNEINSFSFGTKILVQNEQPSNLLVGDFWYQII